MQLNGKMLLFYYNSKCLDHEIGRLIVIEGYEMQVETLGCRIEKLAIKFLKEIQ